ncbi:hypothetical protein ACLMJK_000059 [Lecanora helva]
MRLLVVIGLAASLAVTIGPAAAILLQPRLQDTPAGGTEYYIPATADQLWPSVVDGSDEAPECFGSNVTQRLLCASGGFESLSTYFALLNTSFGLPWKMTTTAYTLIPIIIRSLAPQLPDLQCVGTYRGVGGSDAVYFQPNMVSAVLPDRLRREWQYAANTWSGSPFSSVKQYRYAKETLSRVFTTNAVAHVRCSETQNVSVGLSAVNFPVKSWEILTNATGRFNWIHKEEQYSITIDMMPPVGNVEIDWLPLPTSTFGPVSGGVLMQFPGQVSNNSRAVMGCSISAGWVYVPMTSNPTAFTSAWGIPDISFITGSLKPSSSHSHGSIRPINIGPRWFDSLNAVVASKEDGNESIHLSTLQSLLSNAGFSSMLFDMRTKSYPQFDSRTKSCQIQPPNLTMTDVERMKDVTCGNGGKPLLIEVMLASTFVNGLSRYGSRRVFESDSLSLENDRFHWILKETPKATDFNRLIFSHRGRPYAMLPPPPRSDFITLNWKIQVYGYAWYASSASDYLAICVISVYMLGAIGHTIWILVRGKTSSSWDTTTELLALALQSPVTKLLRGAGAGIERLSTYRHIVRLRAVEDRDGVGDRIVLLIENESGEKRSEMEAGYEMSDSLERNVVAVTAAATPEVSSQIVHRGPKEDASLTYKNVEIDKKYL